MPKTESKPPVVAPKFLNLHPPADDDVVVDGAAALRTLFHVVDDMPAGNLLRLHFAQEPRVCGKLFVATAALMTLLDSRNYSISESPGGVMYVATRTVAEAVMLESQVYASFGAMLSFHRVSTVDREFRYARGDAAAFKIFERERE